MSYKTILVSLNNLEQQKALLEVCAVIARQSESHIVGLFVIPAENV
jgi:hypothetical protein